MTELQRDKTFEPSTTSEPHNSRKRQALGALFFTASFLFLFSGMLLYWVSYAFEIGVGLFFVLQFLSLYVLAGKLRNAA